MVFEEHHSPYTPSKEDFARFGELCGLNFNEEAFDAHEAQVQAAYLNTNEDLSIISEDQVRKILEDIRDAALSDDEAALPAYCEDNRALLVRAVKVCPEIAEALVIGLKIGIDNNSPCNMNYLGTLYYMGDILEQDYQKAAELYEMATNAGFYQSTINLGYIYEYGRIGEPDYQKAFAYYSLAAALYPSVEALYKLGDQFSRGQAVEEDKQKAYLLYERSLEQAEDNMVDISQPAIRLAEMLIDKGNGLYGIEYNPLRALHLYQQAEIGLRISIKHGEHYYKKRLQEAIEGQDHAREIIEAEEATLE